MEAEKLAQFHAREGRRIREELNDNVTEFEYRGTLAIVKQKFPNSGHVVIKVAKGDNEAELKARSPLMLPSLLDQFVDAH